MGLKCWNKVIKKTSPAILDATSKVLLLTVDIVKDVVFWNYLFSRIEFFEQLDLLNYSFVTILIYVNLFIILLAQTVMGIYIIKRLDR